MAQKIDFKIHGIFEADPEKCYKELPDKVTPQNVLEAARDENSELHKCFEWDDSIAAEKYRLQQARKLITFFVVRDEEEEAPPKRILHITSEVGHYEKPTFFMRNEDEYDLLLQRARKAVIDLKNTFHSLTEMEDVFEKIDEFLATF